MIADFAFDWVHEWVPPQYIKNAMASTLTTKMVYKEGTKFIKLFHITNWPWLHCVIWKEKEVVTLLEELKDVNQGSLIEENCRQLAIINRLDLNMTSWSSITTK